MKKKASSDVIPGILLFAKESGRRSFSSLSAIKRALATDKVGHTGTLDSFADGLLVVLSGPLTHLVPHITNFDKSYLALLEFGSETDTLDPTGQVIKKSEKIPSKEEVEAVLPKFIGQIDQIPPLYSALHVDGKRMSDLVREGKSIEAKPRKVTIQSIKLLDYKEKYALIEVNCSKGTYIRSLARDIGKEAGSCAHLKALRRTRVGPFKLEEAFNYEKLAVFNIDAINQRGVVEENSLPKEIWTDEYLSKIASSVKYMNFDLAWRSSMECQVLSSQYISDFMNGRPIHKEMFVTDIFARNPDSSEIAVFYPDLSFAGIITKKILNGKKRFSYGFMVPQRNPFKIYSWEQISSGKFNQDFVKKGIALTIGSFDGSHLGHRELFNAVISQKEKGLVPGVFAFSRSLRFYKNPQTYEGDVVSLSQKIESFKSLGFEFAVIIDFSADFGKIEGRDFLSVLANKCGLKYLAEGIDFHCGYKGSTGVEQIKEIAGQLGFSIEIIDPVIYEGERISSSRIRSGIVEKAFSKVTNMLSHPFELDCTGFKWKLDSERVISTQKKGVQLLPPDGHYKVMVTFYDFGLKSGEAQNYRAAESDCTLENGNLRLAFSDNLISGFVRSIKFM